MALSDQTDHTIVTARYGPKRKAIVIVLAIALVGLIGVMVGAEDEFNPTFRTSLAMVAMILGTPIGILFAEFWFVRIDVTPTSIVCQSPWRSNRIIPLDDVADVDFAPLPQWFRIHTNSNGTVRLHGYLSGLYDVLNALESQGHPFPRVHHVR